MDLIQRARKESILPQVAATAVEPVDVLGVELVRAFQDVGQGGFAVRHDDEMDVIGHQAVTFYSQIKTFRRFGQEGQENLPVIIDEENILAIITPLGNVMSTTCNDNS